MDGIISIAANAYKTNGSASTVGSYFSSLDGGQLHPNGSLGVHEIDLLLMDRWAKFQLGVDEIYVNAQQFKDIRTCVMGNGGNPGFYAMSQADSAHVVTGGGAVFRYFNPFARNQTGNWVDIILHPYQIPGTLVAVSWTLPYMVNNIAEPLEVRYQRDVWETEWPQYDMSYQFTTASIEVLVDYFTPSMSLIQNIAPGVGSIIG